MRKSAWFLVAGGVLAALVFAQISRPNLEAFLRNPTAQALTETYQAIQDQYLSKLDRASLDKVLQGGIKGMVEALNDEFTSYSPPQRAKLRNEDLQGEFFGVGATLSPAQGGGALIQNLYKGFPAYNAGLQLGDVIVEVNGEDVTKQDLDEIVSKIRGPKGTKVSLGVRRGGSGAILRFEMIREKVEIVEVEKAMLPGNIGYVQLNSFGSVKVIQQLTAALQELKQNGAQKLVFDLRDNGGGLLDQGCQVASAFIREGPIVYVRTRSQTRVYCEASGRTSWSGPMVVLVNRRSASASEIVAGALQDTGRAKVIGEISFGKGVGQNVIDLANGANLTLVTFEWLTPKKRSIHKAGITPDIQVKDNRFETPVSFEGTGVKAGETVTLSVNGKTFTATADKDGKFSFSQSFPARKLADERGAAVVDLEKDLVLKRALEELK
ncbi:MAG: S41 family peptidase [Deinococcus sp.]|nr:S41 family peptidase [Deinococcus sp.]MCL5965012.1 S41 family peptidase [Deinococcus sp.]